MFSLKTQVSSDFNPIKRNYEFFCHLIPSQRNDITLSDLLSVLWIDQFRYLKIQPKTIDLITRLWVFVGIIPQSLVLRSIKLG